MVGSWTQAQPIWIKDPACHPGRRRRARRRGRRAARSSNWWGAANEPATANAAVFDASEHVVLPGLINTHHHFYQTLTRALPAALDRELFPWLQALYPVWARLTPESLHLGVTRGDGGTAAVGLHHHHRSSLRVSGRARGRRRYRGRGGEAARHARAADARLDEPVAARRRPAARQRGAGRGHDPGRQRARGRRNITSAARTPWCRSRWRRARRSR